MSHPLQSKEWGEFRAENGNLVSRVNDFQIIWSKIPHTPYYFGTLLKSGIPSKTDLDKFKEEAKKINGIGIRIEPNEQHGDVPAGLVRGRRLFTPQTFWLDLTKSEDDLLKNMHSKSRYNIKVAQKHNVKIYEDNSKFDVFWQLMDATQKRQGFYAHDEKYFRNMWKHLKDKIAHLFVAEYQNEILAAWIIFKYGDIVYYPYGASSDQHRNVMAPSLMLWETALWGKKQGCKTYDLWGVEEGKGFTRFKEQFGPKLVTFVGTYDLPISPILYWLFRLTEFLRWQILDSLRHLRGIWAH
ncbi:peptidoglycan bridge formation glycyltransferase FemA/FemB family protein [Candidatus Amesbacteria bacterium]|nr:peptidoglycan bridge formation glycyltransferase FemA/FemB family protein [Candidatus Amesbacteria bacterium]